MKQYDVEFQEELPEYIVVKKISELLGIKESWVSGGTTMHKQLNWSSDYYTMERDIDGWARQGQTLLFSISYNMYKIWQYNQNYFASKAYQIKSDHLTEDMVEKLKNITLEEELKK